MTPLEHEQDLQSHWSHVLDDLAKDPTARPGEVAFVERQLEITKEHLMALGQTAIGG